jgi:hypothetical protein
VGFSRRELDSGFSFGTVSIVVLHNVDKGVNDRIAVLTGVDQSLMI